MRNFNSASYVEIQGEVDMGRGDFKKFFCESLNTVLPFLSLQETLL